MWQEKAFFGFVWLNSQSSAFYMNYILYIKPQTLLLKTEMQKKYFSEFVTTTPSCLPVNQDPLSNHRIATW
jgi:hypothetical protein